MHPAAPTIALPARLGELPTERGRLFEVEAFLAQAPRACIYARSERASTQPLVRSWLGRKLGLAVTSPVLSPLASKLGGVAYSEADETWTNFIFVGQINFAELPAGVVGARQRESSDSTWARRGTSRSSERAGTHRPVKFDSSRAVKYAVLVHGRPD